MIALLDNTVLSNFSTVKRPDLVKLALGGDAVTTEAAHRELQAGVQIGKLPVSDWSWLTVLPLTAAERARYRELCATLNAGEAACLAVAEARGGRLFTDDRDARVRARQLRVPISGTLGLLTRLVELGHLSPAQADDLLGQMIAAGYRSPVTSLADIL